MKDCYAVLIKELTRSGWPKGENLDINNDEAKRRAITPEGIMRHSSCQSRAQNRQSTYGGFEESFTEVLSKVRHLIAI